MVVEIAIHRNGKKVPPSFRKFCIALKMDSSLILNEVHILYPLKNLYNDIHAVYPPIIMGK